MKKRQNITYSQASSPVPPKKNLEKLENLEKSNAQAAEKKTEAAEKKTEAAEKKSETAAEKKAEAAAEKKAEAAEKKAEAVAEKKTEAAEKKAEAAAEKKPGNQFMIGKKWVRLTISNNKTSPEPSYNHKFICI